MRLAWLLLPLALAGTALAAPTKEQVDEAQQHFFKATDLYNEGDFANAAREFRRAYDLAPNFLVLFNIGQACFQAADYACALDAFQSYLADGGTKVPAKRRADIEKDIKKLQTRVAKVDISVNVPNASITVDDEKRGAFPLEKPLMLSQGKRKITVSKDGYEPKTEIVEIAGGESTTVNFELKEVPKLVVPPPPPPKVERKSPLPFIGVGVTGALAVGAIITGVTAIDASDRANNRLKTLGADPAEIKRLQSDASTFALVTDILAGAAVAVGVTTAILFVLENKSPPKDQPRATFFFGPTSAGLRAQF